MVDKAPIKAISGVKANGREMENNQQVAAPVQPKFDFNFAEVLHKMFGDGDTGANAMVV